MKHIKRFFNFILNPLDIILIFGFYLLVRSVISDDALYSEIYRISSVVFFLVFLAVSAIVNAINSTNKEEN